MPEFDWDDVGPDHPQADERVQVDMSVAEAGLTVQALRYILSVGNDDPERGFLQLAYGALVRALVAKCDPPDGNYWFCIHCCRGFRAEKRGDCIYPGCDGSYFDVQDAKAGPEDIRQLQDYFGVHLQTDDEIHQAGESGP